jgi:hypothetical protein
MSVFFPPFSPSQCLIGGWTRTLNLAMMRRMFYQGIIKGEYHCTVDLLFDWFGISCMTTDIFCFYLQNRLIQTSQTGGQQYNDTSTFSIPWFYHYATALANLAVLILD